jgi:diamine N-acetyltransferase
MSAIALPVSLQEITSETVRSVCSLSVGESQRSFVASNAVSLAQALFSPSAWYRAIYLSEQLVGFVMLRDESLREPPISKPEATLWRFMIDERYQGQGIGKAALLQVIEHVRSRSRFSSLATSYVPGVGCPEKFYLRLGFRHRGGLKNGEVLLVLPLS